MQKLGVWLFNLACKLNPAISLAMVQAVEQRAIEIASAQRHLEQVQAAQQAAMSRYQRAAAARAARQ